MGVKDASWCRTRLQCQTSSFCCWWKCQECRAPTQIKVSKLAYHKFKLKLDKGADSDKIYSRKLQSMIRKGQTLSSQRPTGSQTTPPCILLSISSPAEPVHVYRMPPGRRTKERDTALAREQLTSHARPSLLPLHLFLLHRLCLHQARPGTVIIFISFFALAVVDRFKFLTDFSLIFSWQGLPWRCCFVLLPFCAIFV
jgi:hypothetical protein